MMTKSIAKKDIKGLLRRAIEKWEIYAPLKTKEEDTLFSFLPKDGNELEEALDRVNLKDEWVVISPKDIFFPQLETMLNFEKDTVKGKPETSKKLIFGVRPCDTKGIFFSDEFFKRNFEDIYYLSRAKDRLIVTIGCLKPPRPQACFCTSAKTGPFLEKGYDLQLVDTKDSYIVEIGSDIGKDFVNSYPDIFKETAGSEKDKVKNIKYEAIKAVQLKVDFEKALELMKEDKVYEENYKRIGERCIYCGACLYACPTCTCFNVFDTSISLSVNGEHSRTIDDKEDGRGVRKRNWDACVFEGYTREASARNPRKEKWHRTARRYEHKLKYDYKITGMAGCIACGRCLASCPVEIGISKFIEEITTNTRKI